MTKQAKKETCKNLLPKLEEYRKLRQEIQEKFVGIEIRENSEERQDFGFFLRMRMNEFADIYVRPDKLRKARDLSIGISDMDDPRLARVARMTNIISDIKKEKVPYFLHERKAEEERVGEFNK